MIISITSFIILFCSAWYCLALKLLFFVPPKEEPFFAPKLGPRMNSFCILLSSHFMAEHVVGV